MFVSPRSGIIHPQTPSGDAKSPMSVRGQDSSVVSPTPPRGDAGTDPPINAQKPSPQPPPRSPRSRSPRTGKKPSSTTASPATPPPRGGGTARERMLQYARRRRQLAAAKKPPRRRRNTISGLPRLTRQPGGAPISASPRGLKAGRRGGSTRPIRRSTLAAGSKHEKLPQRSGGDVKKRQKRVLFFIFSTFFSFWGFIFRAARARDYFHTFIRLTPSPARQSAVNVTSAQCVKVQIISKRERGAVFVQQDQHQRLYSVSKNATNVIPHKLPREQTVWRRRRGRRVRSWRLRVASRRTLLLRVQFESAFGWGWCQS